ncbi:MAG: phage portal protein [Agathobacter rectalis]
MPRKNSVSLGNNFLRYGNNKMTPNWDEVMMNDRDFYTGYSYAAIKIRANTVARLALEHVRTESNDAQKDDFIHPYLDVISKSPSFSDYQFWHNVSVYLDLEGVFYLMAVRNSDETKFGEIQYFRMLNPYNVRRVLSSDGLKIEGYIETRNGMIRTIPTSMIIEIKELNPFDEFAPYAMTDAAKESQFVMKTSSDYTRHTLRNNINAPGIISTGVVLDTETFKNFQNRIKEHTKGEPLFGNGSGALTYDNMQTALKDAALEKVTEVSRDELFTTAGVSKTIMGIEQSGTTRETSKTQKDLHIESQSLPRIQLIIDALNQDYKNKYPDEFKTTGADLVIDNPNATDHDADLKAATVKKTQFDIYDSLIAKGYTDSIASQFVNGEIGLEDLGKPTEKPRVDPTLAQDMPMDPKKMPKPKQKPKKNEIEDVVIEQPEPIKNEDTGFAGLVQQQQGFLKNAIVNVEEQMALRAINKVTIKTAKNTLEEDFADEADIITVKEKKEFVNELVLILTAFYGVVMNLEGGKTMRDRAGKFALPGDFSFGNDIRKYIKDIAEKSSISHVDTVASDLFEIVRQDAIAGLGQAEMISNIRNKYSKHIVESRAKAIARSEANRAFTRAQFEADKQFIDQNELHDRAYKKWRTRSAAPCSFCQALAAEPPIPFTQNFRALGQEVEADGKTLKVGFESLQAGNAHTNCSCEYELIIVAASNQLNKLADELKTGIADVKQTKQDLEGYMDILNNLL